MLKVTMKKLYFALSILIGKLSIGLMFSLFVLFNKSKIDPILHSHFTSYSKVFYILAFLLAVVIVKKISMSYEIDIRSKKHRLMTFGIIIFYFHLALKVLGTTEAMYFLPKPQYFASSSLPANFALILVTISLFAVFLDAVPKLRNKKV